jgi:hypothetical protein
MKELAQPNEEFLEAHRAAPDAPQEGENTLDYADDFGDDDIPVDNKIAEEAKS